MTTEIVDIEYREYTTEGRFIAKSRFVSSTHGNTIREDIEAITDPELTVPMHSCYLSQGILQYGEELKEIWNTNIVVRDPSTGRFMKWKY